MVLGYLRLFLRGFDCFRRLPPGCSAMLPEPKVIPCLHGATRHSAPFSQYPLPPLIYFLRTPLPFTWFATLLYDITFLTLETPLM